MTAKMLDEIGKVLKDNGFEFTAFGSRFNTNSQDNRVYYSYFGVLRDNEETTIAYRRLTGVLATMKEKEIFLILSPKVQTVRRYWEPLNKATYIEPREVMICFIEKGLFQTFEDAAVRVRDSLKENFAYFQEDENILNLERLVTQTHEAFAAFQRGAYDVQLVEGLSVQLRAHLLATDVTYSGTFFPYLEDKAHRQDAEKMCSAAHCLDVVCAGTE